MSTQPPHTPRAPLFDQVEVIGLWCNDSTGGLVIACNAHDEPREIEHDGQGRGGDDSLTLARIIELVTEHYATHPDHGGKT